MVTLSRPQKQSSSQVPSLVRAGLLIAAALLILLSLNKPWWGMLMYAPQYPSGLEITAYLSGMQGDVAELDTLNHYIGMMPLADAARLELAVARCAVPAMAGLLLLSIFAVGRLAWALRLPAISFPPIFLADLSFWLWYAGNNLDPRAPMRNTISAFTPTPLGEGSIAQFVTYGYLEPGFWMATLAAVLALLAGFAHKLEPKGGAKR